MKYIFDTNILIHYLRRTPLSKKIDAQINPFASGNTLLLSIVSIGEIRSISIQNNWGASRLAALQNAFLDFVIVGIIGEDIIERYAEIDAYSQGKLPNRVLPTSSRNMGKNDLWIAATGSILKATLLTTDQDFDHLMGHFLDVIRFES